MKVPPTEIRNINTTPTTNKPGETQQVQRVQNNNTSVPRVQKTSKPVLRVQKLAQTKRTLHTSILTQAPVYLPNQPPALSTRLCVAHSKTIPPQTPIKPTKHPPQSKLNQLTPRRYTRLQAKMGQALSAWQFSSQHSFKQHYKQME